MRGTIGPTLSTEELQAESVAKMDALKEALRREIRGRRIPQRELARRLGYSDSYLANLFGDIRGREPANLRVDTLVALCRLLELDAGAFVTRELARFGPAEGKPAAVSSPLLDFAALAERAGELPAEQVEGLVQSTLHLVSEVSRLLHQVSASPRRRRSPEVH